MENTVYDFQFGHTAKETIENICKVKGAHAVKQ